MQVHPGRGRVLDHAHLLQPADGLPLDQTAQKSEDGLTRIGLDEICQGTPFEADVVGTQDPSEGWVCLENPRSSFENQYAHRRVFEDARHISLCLDQPLTEDGREEAKPCGRNCD